MPGGLDMTAASRPATPLDSPGDASLTAQGTAEPGQQALEAILQSAESHTVDPWDLRRACFMRFRRDAPWREIFAGLCLLAAIIVIYSQTDVPYNIVQISSDPPRWRLVRNDGKGKGGGASDRVGMPREGQAGTDTPDAPGNTLAGGARFVVPSAAPTPDVDPQLAAKEELGKAEQLLAQGQLDAALAAYREGVRLLPPGGDSSASLRIAVFNRVGLALRNAGRLPEAIATFRNGVHQFPQDASLETNLGVVLENAGGAENTRAALAAFQSALRLDPSNTDARDNVAAALRSSGRAAEAGRLTAVALPSAPSLAVRNAVGP